MPWEIIRKGSQYCVRNKDTGENEKCYATKEDAVVHQRALYASVDDDHWKGAPYYKYKGTKKAEKIPHYEGKEFKKLEKK